MAKNLPVESSDEYGRSVLPQYHPTLIPARRHMRRQSKLDLRSKIISDGESNLRPLFEVIPVKLEKLPSLVSLYTMTCCGI